MSAAAPLAWFVACALARWFRRCLARLAVAGLAWASAAASAQGVAQSLVVPAPGVQVAQPVSAALAQQRIAAGAAVWDVRAQADAHLPGAVRLDAASVQRWLLHGDLSALSAAATEAGLNLSADVLVYGDAGDALAQAISQRLPNVVRGQVHWFVGGVAEWRALGLPTQAQADRRLALPQRLSAWLPAKEAAAAPASASLRRTADAAPAASLLTASLR
jgi:3-mercaptopyruvate sulfurtransferase SseA